MTPAIDARGAAALAGGAQRFEFEERIDGQMHRFDGHMQPDRSHHLHLLLRQYEICNGVTAPRTAEFCMSGFADRPRTSW